MFDHAWRVLFRRPRLWTPVAVLATIGALPGPLVATVLAVPATSLLVTGDPFIAVALLPAPLDGTGAAAALAWAGVAVAWIAGMAAWTRLYSVAVWLSDERKDGSAAWRSTRSSWRTALAVNLEAQVVVGALAAAVLFLLFLAPGGAGGGTGAFLAVSMVLLLRTIIRIGATLAVRAAVLDGGSHPAVWRTARAMLRERRSEATAAWVALLAAGVGLWLGGRLITPVLQETALDYPHDSLFTVGHEFAQLAFAIPLEAFLLGLSLTVWTAVYTGAPRDRSPDGVQSKRQLVPMLAALVVLVIFSNGLAAVVDARWSSRDEAARALIETREIRPEDALAQAPAGDASTGYLVRARLRDETLSWDTTIHLENRTGESLTDIGLNLYPAAYTRDIPEIPLARDLLANDVNRIFSRQVTKGTFEIVNVSVGDEEVPAELDGTGLTVPLSTPLVPGAEVELDIGLTADLPHFPERFGIWDDQVLLGNWIPQVAVRENGEWRLDDFGTVGDPFFSETADYQVGIEMDDRYGVVGTGNLISVSDQPEGTRVWTFGAAGVRDAAFAAAPFMKGLEGRAGGVTVRSWYLPEERIEGRDNLTDALSAATAFSESYGQLPFGELDVVATRGLFGGMEYPGTVFVSSGVRVLEGIPIIPDLLRHASYIDAQRTYVIGHEIAHQWWYAAVGSDQVGEPWLDESLAEATNRIWLARRPGHSDTSLKANLETARAPTPGLLGSSLEDFTDNTEYTDRIYLEGAELLLRLRRVMGHEEFEHALRLYYEENAGGIGTTEAFLEAVEEAGGADALRVLTPYL